MLNFDFNKAFDLAKNEVKGLFPYYFNTLANYEKNNFDKHPPAEDFGIQFMSQKKRDELLKCYETVCDKPYDLKEQLSLYCRQDVNVLRQGVLKFRKSVMDNTKRNNTDKGIDPFEECLTPPSLCHKIHTSLHMEPGTIALINDLGIDPSTNFSHKQMQWLA